MKILQILDFCALPLLFLVNFLKQFHIINFWKNAILITKLDIINQKRYFSEK